jgi:hypothetical protein
MVLYQARKRIRRCLIVATVELRFSDPVAILVRQRARPRDVGGKQAHHGGQGAPGLGIRLLSLEKRTSLKENGLGQMLRIRILSTKLREFLSARSKNSSLNVRSAELKSRSSAGVAACTVYPLAQTRMKNAKNNVAMNEN